MQDIEISEVRAKQIRLKYLLNAFRSTPTRINVIKTDKSKASMGKIFF